MLVVISRCRNEAQTKCFADFKLAKLDRLQRILEACFL